MKFIKRLERYLVEKVGQGLYHFTQLQYACNILKTNEISLTSAAGSSADLAVNKKKFFFFSLTRSRSQGYTLGQTKILFDDNKLKQNYKIIPVDYWNWSKNPDDYETTSEFKFRFQFN